LKQFIVDIRATGFYKIILYLKSTLLLNRNKHKISNDFFVIFINFHCLNSFTALPLFRHSRCSISKTGSAVSACGTYKKKWWSTQANS